MEITFLCAKHKEWVYCHPVEALHFLARDELQGELLLQEGCFREAIAYLGCAFDIALILHELEEGHHRAMKTKIGALAVLLYRCFGYVGAPDCALAVAARAIACLAPERTTEAASLSSDGALAVLAAITGKPSWRNVAREPVVSTH